MIEANELMRGNELLYKGVSVAVRKIDDGEIYCCGGSDTTYFETGWKPLSEFSPIPLTPELLEKAGFEKKEMGTSIVYELLLIDSHFEPVRDLKLRYSSKNVSCEVELMPFFKDKRKYKYLHEIQNIYHAIKGEELPFCKHESKAEPKTIYDLLNPLIQYIRKIEADCQFILIDVPENFELPLNREVEKCFTGYIKYEPIFLKFYDYTKDTGRTEVSGIIKDKQLFDYLAERFEDFEKSYTGIKSITINI